jgi:hypothetical protein
MGTLQNPIDRNGKDWPKSDKIWQTPLSLRPLWNVDRNYNTKIKPSEKSLAVFFSHWSRNNKGKSE